MEKTGKQKRREINKLTNHKILTYPPNNRWKKNIKKGGMNM